MSIINIQNDSSYNTLDAKLRTLNVRDDLRINGQEVQTVLNAVTTNGVQTLTNKTIDDTNTINIGALDISGQQIGDILFYDGAKWSRLPASTEGKALITHATDPPTWEIQAISVGEIYFGDGIATYPLTLTVQNQWYPVAPSTTLISNNALFNSPNIAMPGNGQLQKISNNMCYYAVSFNFSSSADNAPRLYEIGLFINGVLNINTNIPIDYIQNNVFMSSSYNKVILLNQNDVVQLYARCTTAINTVLTFKNVNISLQACRASY